MKISGAPSFHNSSLLVTPPHKSSCFSSHDSVFYTQWDYCSLFSLHIFMPQFVRKPEWKRTLPMCLFFSQGSSYTHPCPILKISCFIYFNLFYAYLLWEVRYNYSLWPGPEFQRHWNFLKVPEAFYLFVCCFWFYSFIFFLKIPSRFRTTKLVKYSLIIIRADIYIVSV